VDFPATDVAELADSRRRLLILGDRQLFRYDMILRIRTFGHQEVAWQTKPVSAL